MCLTAPILSTDVSILLFGLLLVAGVLATRVSTRFGLPALILFMGIGMVMGSDVTGLIFFDDSNLAQMIGISALIVILFEGGLQTKWASIRSVLAPSASLATIGVLLTAGFVAVAVRFVFGFDWIESFLFGAIIGSTDAAAVFAAFKGKNIAPKVGATLEAESGTNDPMAMFLTILALDFMLKPDTTIWDGIGMFILQIIVGAFAGYMLGNLSRLMLNHLRLESSGLHAVLMISMAFMTYGVAAYFAGSGLLAVYLAAMIVGNAHTAHEVTIVQFSEALAWIMQIIMFVILGLLVYPKQLFDPELIWKGLLISFFLMFVARPIAVYLSTIAMPFTHKEKLFISWAGLKGAVPIVLATFPLIAGIDNSQLIFNAVFFVVVTSALIQGTTLTPLAARLNLLGPDKIRSPYTIALVSSKQSQHQLVPYVATETSSMIGRTLADITLPPNTVVNAIVRKDYLIPPTGQTKIEPGDLLYVLASTYRHDQLDRKFGEDGLERVEL
ncbi:MULTISPECIES: potassium/proton antiporter [unclassified Exiguobacterium]|uniref:potassium/proton antiporter n=1 Tax=unclassified Exiguobacterium TaxID=2644629 RepID=UPI00103C9E5C|nr:MULTISPECIES: potassium/proton antiporter [unclassified Exiguobacterium]TCI36456.1 potassium/proton antiporter [Exiguobacterium sp. SH4S7]TCI48506.1 potassium/proton antiporter [Exiguobacterium sp. SH5S32]TCI55393.1 potassium/proton antiporter [Exiguobacterium sp. SH1S4]TCI63404.1 potassium/proton antiporter [Exiguobacterium sp. SH0S2]TCI75187.1 potassium/proton antiporter [Exiguobacterium sp. SH1S1]